MIAIYISDTADIGVEKLVSHWYSTSDIANHVSDTAGTREHNRVKYICHACPYI